MIVALFKFHVFISFAYSSVDFSFSLDIQRFSEIERSSSLALTISVWQLFNISAYLRSQIQQIQQQTQEHCEQQSALHSIESFKLTGRNSHELFMSRDQLTLGSVDDAFDTNSQTHDDDASSHSHDHYDDAKCPESIVKRCKYGSLEWLR